MLFNACPYVWVLRFELSFKIMVLKINIKKKYNLTFLVDVDLTIAILYRWAEQYVLYDIY